LTLIETVKDRLSLRGIDVEELYRLELGLTYSELAALSFGAWAQIVAVKGRFALDIERWGRDDNALHIQPERVQAWFNATSLTYSAFQAKANDPRIAFSGYDGFALSPLIQWPLVIRTDGFAVAPVADTELWPTAPRSQRWSGSTA
jgi:hypothetical protein